MPRSVRTTKTSLHSSWLFLVNSEYSPGSSSSSSENGIGSGVDGLISGAGAGNFEDFESSSSRTLGAASGIFSGNVERPMRKPTASVRVATAANWSM